MEAVGNGDADGDAESEGDGDGDADAESDGDGDGDAESDGVGVSDGVGDAESDGVGVGESDGGGGDAGADGDAGSDGGSRKGGGDEGGVSAGGGGDGDEGGDSAGDGLLDVTVHRKPTEPVAPDAAVAVTVTLYVPAAVDEMVPVIRPLLLIDKPGGRPVAANRGDCPSAALSDVTCNWIAVPAACCWLLGSSRRSAAWRK